jgi:hypothetical protein
VYEVVGFEVTAGIGAPEIVPAPDRAIESGTVPAFGGIVLIVVAVVTGLLALLKFPLLLEVEVEVPVVAPLYMTSPLITIG